MTNSEPVSEPVSARSYGNVQHEFLLADKPEHPLAILTGQDWVVVGTTLTAVAQGGDGLASDLLLFTHYVRLAE